MSDYDDLMDRKMPTLDFRNKALAEKMSLDQKEIAALVRGFEKCLAEVKDLNREIAALKEEVELWKDRACPEYHQGI